VDGWGGESEGLILGQWRIRSGRPVNRPRPENRTRSNCQAIASVLYWPLKRASVHRSSTLEGDL